MSEEAPASELQDRPEETKFTIAKKAAQMMANMIAPLPPEAALEAATMLMKALYMTHIKPEARLNLFNRCMASLRAEIKADLEAKRKKR